MAQRKRDVLLLVGLALAAGICAVGFFSLGVDRENRSMRSQNTGQAAAEALRDEAFGRHSPLLFMLAPLDADALDALHDPEVDAWTGRLRALPWVDRAIVLPRSTREAIYVVVSVADEHGGRFFEHVQATVDFAWAHRPAGYDFHTTGQALGEMAISGAMAAEVAHVVPFVLGALCLLLLLAYRRVVLAAGILASALLGIFVLGGIQWALGLPTNPITSLLPPVLLTVGVAGSVHLVEAFLGQRARGQDAREATRTAVRSLRRPATLTISTTMVGFLALLANPIPAVWQFGLLAGLGVALTCGLTFLWLPAWLRLLAGGPAFSAMRHRGRAGSHMAGALALLLRRRARAITLVGVTVVALFAWAWTGLTVDTQPLHLLPPHSTFREETEAVAESLGGIESFDLLLPGGASGHAASAYIELYKVLRHEPLVAGVLGLPESAKSGVSRQRVLLRPSGTGPRARLFERLESRARDLGWTEAVAAGTPVIVARDSNELVATLLYSLGFTLAFLWAAMALGLRSPRLALLGLIPNVVPAVLLYGGLALAGRPLSVGSAMIGSVLLGLMVDDTIHFLHRYRQARRRGSSIMVSIARSLRIAGRALLVTTVVEALGFLACLAGALDSSREFAVLASATMVLALAADLLLLPSLLLLSRRTVRS